MSRISVLRRQEVRWEVTVSGVAAPTGEVGCMLPGSVNLSKSLPLTEPQFAQLPVKWVIILAVWPWAGRLVSLNLFLH